MTTSDLVLRVEQVCLDVVRSGQHVTFATVAARTGLSRSTLYRHVELRALIQEQRVHARHALTLSGLAVESTSCARGWKRWPSGLVTMRSSSAA